MPRARQASVSARHSCVRRQHPGRVVRRVHDDEARLRPYRRHEPVDVERPAVGLAQLVERHVRAAARPTSHRLW